MTDDEASEVIELFLDLSEAMRSDKRLAIERATSAVLALPDMRGAVCVAASMLPPREQLDVWWQPAKLPVSLQRQVEQGIARGDAITKLCTATGCTKGQYYQVLNRMNRAVSE